MIEKIEKFQILILGLILALGGIIATGIIADSISKDVITVTGSYSQNVTSDKGALEFYVNTRTSSRSAAFNTLKKQQSIVLKYLKDQGIKTEDIDIKSPNGYNVYHIAPNGASTNQIDGFDANQWYSIKSSDVKKIKKISTDIISLTDKGLDISCNEPEYFYSKLSDLKVEMLKKATKDAKQRASAMLKATHNRVGKIQSLHMGVFQITPEDSTNVSDSGISDTSSINKKVTSVANVTFRIK